MGDFNIEMANIVNDDYLTMLFLVTDDIHVIGDDYGDELILELTNLELKDHRSLVKIKIKVVK